MYFLFFYTNGASSSSGISSCLTTWLSLSSTLTDFTDFIFFGGLSEDISLVGSATLLAFDFLLLLFFLDLAFGGCSNQRIG